MVRPFTHITSMVSSYSTIMIAFVSHAHAKIAVAVKLLGGYYSYCKVQDTVPAVGRHYLRHLGTSHTTDAL